MSTPAPATLTCSHDECGCRIEIAAPCGWQGTGQYTCHCGAPMVPPAG